MRASLLAAASLVLGVASEAAAAPSPAECVGLNGQQIAGAAITDAVVVGATPLAPEYCKVSGLIAPELKFELRLPNSWNGKLHYSGGGGFDGVIRPLNPGVLAQGYGDVASNGGHDGNNSTFARDPQKLTLFVRESVPTVTPVAREVMRRYYGSAPVRAYFEGCSAGGREALTAAIHNPDLFDGVIAGAPARTSPIALMQRAARLAALPGATISPTKMAMVHKAVMARCDAKDGLADGIVSDWSCRFDPKTLRCPGGVDAGDTCLSDAQVAVLTALTSPITLAGGRKTELGYYMNGAETLPGGWDRMAFGPTSAFVSTVNSYVKDFIAKDVTVDAMGYDFNAHAREVMALYDLWEVTANISPFARRGKLIVWTGAGDPGVPPAGTLGYYKDFVSNVGGKAKADASMRFYFFGGVGHCRGGTGADRTDALLPALDAWVTQGRAPQSLTATRIDAETGKTLFSRPLCPYPTYAHYKGTGDVTAASSFRCVAARSAK
ncbi:MULTISPECIES: tannase/feruloyl esterase family alpha/beta hydrolase [unclassified Phenylobacterium]|uniref:tannase/feruloyl esterase family alpha/beta hydrolase n=1 Tax=unclassified Phenylobacterium TaxID=2640670 RepID=UPI00083A9020|nr:MULTISPECIES: tannase/feruloyl esterase family alpha/beta hydrolase [unclassified Phenylobacterium]